MLGVRRAAGPSNDRPRVASVTTIDLTQRFILLGQLRRLQDEGFDVACVNAPGRWRGDLEAEGFRYLPWPHASRSWAPLRDVAAFWALVRIFRRERFDLVHTHTPKAGFFGRLAAWVAGVPCVVNTVHGFYATPDDPPAKRVAVLALERLAVRASDVELFVSEEDLRWARRIGLVSRSKGTLVSNGVDLSEFSPSALDADRAARLRRELGIPEGSLVVGTVGRMVVEKGYRQLFAAASGVQPEGQEVRFLVVGVGDPGERNSISSEEVADADERFVFTGWRTDVRDLLGLMDVFVLPSWREGLPVSAIQAAAMGKALVLTDIRGCREVVRDGVDGILVAPRDQAVLEASISKLVSDPVLRHRLGTAARERAVRRFDERRTTGRIVDVYRRLLRRKGVLATEPGTVELRAARSKDLASIARLHRLALPDAFLPILGQGFLMRLYRALGRDPDATVVVAESEGDVVGFAAATPSVRGFYRRFFRRHGVGAALAAAPRLVRPGVIRRVIQTARYPASLDGAPDAELLAIAVAPQGRGRGIGMALGHRVLAGLADHGAGQVRVVVAASNAPANRLYARLGFRRWGELALHDGVVSNVWVGPTDHSGALGSSPQLGGVASGAAWESRRVRGLGSRS